MPERDTYDSDSSLAKGGAPATPRASGEVVGARGAPESSGPQASGSPMPESSMRAFELRSVPPDATPLPSEPSDTLLSAGKPADRLEVMREDRLAQVDERLRELSQRCSIIPQKKSSAPASEVRLKPWLWLAFLVALVDVFQLLRHVR